MPQPTVRPTVSRRSASSAASAVRGDRAAAPAESAETPVSGTLEERVLAVLELIRPAIQADGGDIELLNITEEGDVTVRLLGACVGCPSSGLTLRNGIERQLRDRIAQVRSVRSAERNERPGRSD